MSHWWWEFEGVNTWSIICMTLTLVCKAKMYWAVSLKSPSKFIDCVFGISLFNVLTLVLIPMPRLLLLLLHPSTNRALLLFIKILLFLCSILLLFIIMPSSLPSTRFLTHMETGHVCDEIQIKCLIEIINKVYIYC